MASDGLVCLAANSSVGADGTLVRGSETLARLAIDLNLLCWFQGFRCRSLGLSDLGGYGILLVASGGGPLRCPWACALAMFHCGRVEGLYCQALILRI
jgi:hypothetical protein